VLLDAGITLRGLFLINPQGMVAYQLVHDLGIGRNVEGLARFKSAARDRKDRRSLPSKLEAGKKTMKADPTWSKEYFSSQE
jgi:peroxiredoxin (alkyl hydroperoxide reductase subunit C)